MKSLYEVLRLKEQQSEQLQKEIDALRLCIKLLDETSRPEATENKYPAGLGVETSTVATANSAKRFP